MAKQMILRISPPSAGAADTLAQMLAEAVAGLGDGGRSTMAGLGRTKKQVGGRDAMLILTAGPGVTDEQMIAVADIASRYRGLFKVDAEVLDDGKVISTASSAPAPAPAPAPVSDPDPEPEGDEGDEGGVSPYDGWTVADLSAELSERGLPKSGNKADLVARLEADDSDEGDSDEDGGDSGDVTAED